LLLDDADEIEAENADRNGSAVQDAESINHESKPK
jgi:hypothetical protein